MVSITSSRACAPGCWGSGRRSDVDRSGDGHYQLEGTQDESNVWGYARKPFLGRVEVVSGRVPRVLGAWMLAPQREPIVILLEAHSVGQPGPSPVKGEEPRAVRHLSCDNPADASDGLGDLGDFRGLPPESSHACRDLGCWSWICSTWAARGRLGWVNPVRSAEIS